MNEVRIDESWKAALKVDFVKPYWGELTDFVKGEYHTKTVYPPPREIFRAFDLCPFDKVKVVIVGQDPYHGPRQANGLSFAVGEGIPLPPSLKNIFKEIEGDLGIKTLPSGDLSRWAKQGVLMLNSVLTVAAGIPASHAGKGWEHFTDSAIQILNEKRDHIVFMLWGKYAQSKGLVIDRKKNLVLASGHPSPYSAHLFIGNHHFSQCNEYLEKHDMSPINWE
ncbi:MAG: Uracil-DNA glycosylase [Microgenomates bacterium OLB22]|nr:MAG: Uracil-DNA glycosylase [Microgenomates bacterium OLB22]